MLLCERGVRLDICRSPRRPGRHIFVVVRPLSVFILPQLARSSCVECSGRHCVRSRLVLTCTGGRGDACCALRLRTPGSNQQQMLGMAQRPHPDWHHGPAGLAERSASRRRARLDWARWGSGVGRDSHTPPCCLALRHSKFARSRHSRPQPTGQGSGPLRPVWAPEG